MHDVAVIDNPAAAEASLDPIRAGLLAELAEPGSASTLAARVGLTRQKANSPAGARAPRPGGARRGAPQGQLHRARAPGDGRVLRDLADRAVGGRAGSSREPDQRSARWLLAVAGRLVGEVGELITGGRGRQAARDPRDRQRDRFASAKDRAAFAASSRTPSTASSRSTTTRPPPAAVRTVRRRAAPNHHEDQGAPVMSRDFEVTREVDLPAARTTSGPRSPPIRGLAVPDRDGDPRRRGAARGRAGHDLGPAAPSRDPHGVADGTFNALDYAIEAATAARRTCATSTAGSSPTSGRTSTTPSAATRTSTSTRSGSSSSTSTAVRSPTSASRRPASRSRGRRHAGRDGHAARRPRRLPRRGVGDEVHASLGDAGTLDGVDRLLDAGVPRRPHRRRPVPLLGRNHYGSVVGMSAHLFVDGGSTPPRARRRSRRGWTGVYA